MKMELTISELQTRLRVISFIPESKVSQSTRFKIIRYQVAVEKLLKEVQEDIQEAVKKIKPEGFDEKYQKYVEALEGKDTDVAKEQAESEGFKEFKAEYDKVNGEFVKLSEDFNSEKRSVDIPEFTDADLLDILSALPSGETTKAKVDNKEIDISNDELAHTIVANF
jgi:uncharacterized protein (UPF0335 family)